MSVQYAGGNTAIDIPAAETERILDERGFGFWMYLMSDAIIFALLFATYVVMSSRNAGGPTGHHIFGLTHTFIETMLLLTSSTTFGFASVFVRERRPQPVLAWLFVTFLLGAGFVGMEISELHGLVTSGAGPGRSGFLSAFFTLVGTHGLHVSMGLGWIVILSIQTSLRGLTPSVASRLYRLSLFWHLLDIVWIGIFSIVYLPGVL
jgi:cytochrome o ubiquinol oxidase subunit 3